MKVHDKVRFTPAYYEHTGTLVPPLSQRKLGFISYKVKLRIDVTVPCKGGEDTITVLEQDIEVI